MQLKKSGNPEIINNYNHHCKKYILIIWWYFTKGGHLKILEFSLLLVRSYWNFHTIFKIGKKTLVVHENFSI